MRLPYLYCYVRFFISSAFYLFLSQWFPIAIHAKMQCVPHIAVSYVMSESVLWTLWVFLWLLLLLFFFLFWRDEERERTIVFHFALFYHSHFDESGRYFFGMKRCALTYAFDGMQPNENIQFQLFALRETDGHILPMYESEYKQHTHTHTQMSIVYDSLSMYECYMRTIKCNTYFFGFG